MAGNVLASSNVLVTASARRLCRGEREWDERPCSG